MPYADDYGHTHGLSITGVTQLKNGIRLRLSYSTDLYTQQAGKKDAEGRTPQYFMDENFARFIIDNIDAGKIFYWKAEVGWHRMSDEYKTNYFNASTQQMLFHQWLDPYISQRQPRNLGQGYGTRNGVMGGGAVGIQKSYKYGPVEFHPSAEVGFRQSTLPDADYVYISTELGASYVISPRYRVNLSVGAEAKKHYAGTQNTFSIDASFESSNWIFGGGVNYYRGDIDNHVRYNNPSINGEMEPVYYVYASYRYGNKSSKGETTL